MEGVAYTTGSKSHKEIHLSLDHIARSAPRSGDEARGVLTHELVHCFQQDGQGTVPIGLIEGVAGKCSLFPSHTRNCVAELARMASLHDM
jgi:hypothetical protein